VTILYTVADLRYHHNIVKKGTHDAANDLGDKRGCRGQFVLLSQFQITEQQPSLSEGIVSIRCEVHVC
jgi:hypothetical protein